MSWESNNYPWAQQSGSGYPTRVISGTKILELGEGQQQTLIGYTTSYTEQLESTCQQATEAAERYYARLVELGDIVPPKSQEEINGELLSIIKTLSEKLDRLEGDKNGSNSNGTTGRKDVQSTVSRTGKRKNEEIPAEQRGVTEANK